MRGLSSRYAVSLVLSMLLSVLRAAGQESDLYGVIEIGTSGLKPIVVQAVGDSAQERSGDEESAQSIEPYRVIEKVPVEEVNALNKEMADRVADVANSVLKAMMETYHVPPKHIFVVGSSGLAGQESKPIVEAKVNAAIGCNMDFITSNDEAVFTFKGILDTLPASVREKRRGQVLFIDVGSGTIRGAYLTQVRSARYDTFEIPWGTKSFTKKVDEMRGEGGDYVEFADVRG